MAVDLEHLLAMVNLKLAFTSVHVHAGPPTVWPLLHTLSAGWMRMHNTVFAMPVLSLVPGARQWLWRSIQSGGSLGHDRCHALTYAMAMYRAGGVPWRTAGAGATPKRGGGLAGHQQRQRRACRREAQPFCTRGRGGHKLPQWEVSVWLDLN